ncbi:Vegetative incompatibility protein HET-E-1 OS=Podospora anserina GN=HET-E1 PE=4 SV=1 [Rhizoctonia solani AG-1 IB]|uniref:Vegetative incompatibility protein HET-E-1 n=1 Tax=Thanatephorus cucumeris (strain AG1-IB / isolate 7/3/14) TaxID=1108050 RepID=A0A0B7FM52_THACB|nr:Vegetative incompatibility protein HET-E-1 OS=Podospora anserina GN=HET-E1 PE=4 SV=1 [Rhizoctonia solani AG-1 IB]
MPLQEKTEALEDRIKENFGRESDQDVLGAQSPTSLHSIPTVPQTSLSPNIQTLHHALSESNVTTIETPPTQSTSGWVFLEGLASAMSLVADAFGPLKDVFDELVGCVRIYEIVANDQQEYRKLRSDLEDSFRALQAHFTGANTPTMTESLNTSQSVQNATEQKIKKLRSQVETGESITKDIHSGYVQSQLARLPFSASACYNSAQAIELKRAECTPGTRIDVLAHMHSWASMSSPDAGSVYWLNGMAGTGKTTIAYSLCTELNIKHQLAASFFCSRLLPECRDVNRIIPSLSYQLAQYSLPFRIALLKVLEQDPDVYTRLPSMQFEELIAKPLLAARTSLPANSAIVIDALDECEKKDSIRIILNILLNNDMQLPVKFFVSSRPEPEIREGMGGKLGKSQRSQLVLHELDANTVHTDIEKYIRAALAPMDRLSNAHIAKLVANSGVLFIYAATAVRYISDRNFSRNPYGRLQNVLNVAGLGQGRKDKTIDGLYASILQAALEDEETDKAEREDMMLLLHTIIVAQEPLTINALSGLLRLSSEDRAKAAIHPLWSVLHVTGSNELVTTLHASFADFMFDRDRSKGYHCDQDLHNEKLAQLCFACISATEPRFNICNLESSFVLDRDVSDLDQRVRKTVPPHLLYACRYWVHHFTASPESSELASRVQYFTSTQLLLWLEVMNLTGSMQAAVNVMRQVDDWMAGRTATPELKELVHDAWCFTTSFASNLASASTPHIYISMLPFWPSSRPISRAYSHLFPRLHHVDGPAMDMRQLAVLATWSLPDRVLYAAFSPDGSRVVFASESQLTVVDAYSGRAIGGSLHDHTSMTEYAEFSPDSTRIISCSHNKSICVWDVETGELLLGPLEAHFDFINSVQYSPDGTCIASGSWGGAIRIWDAVSGEAKLVFQLPEKPIGAIFSIRYSPDGAHIAVGMSNGQLYIRDASTGALKLGPFIGHTDSVTSMDYSPDGTRVASGSNDKTIRVWSAARGDLVLGPFIGHTGRIWSVKYSPNGRHIVSGSDDRTVRVWDAQTGDTILGPLEGHHSLIMSVCYSPDSSRLVSCAYEGDAIVWDARSQQKALPAADGCTKGVESVAYSSDGAHVVSGSGKDIHIWNASTGDLILGPITAHTDTVTSVDYSPAGDQFASGSYDGTIYIWDARTGAVLLGPLTGHTEWVTSVAYSPSGTSLASGSGDGTVRTWDTRSGDMILGPLHGHTDMVATVRYSPTGTYITSCSWDRTIRIWDARSGDVVLGPLTEHTDSILSIDFSPDGTRLASSSDDGSIHVWDTQTGQAVLGPLEGRAGIWGQVRYSPTGSYIYSCQDNRIRVLDAHTGNVALGPLTGHSSRITSIDVSYDGRRIISGSLDRVLRVWDVQLKVRPPHIVY